MYLPSNPNYHLVNISCILLLIAFIIAFVIAFFVKSSSPKKRLCHIGGTIFFICSMTYASLFHIYDLMFSFSAKNISIDAAFILQQNGSLFFGFLCMGAFSVFSILIDYKKSNCPNRCGMRSGLQYLFCSHSAHGIISSSEYIQQTLIQD